MKYLIVVDMQQDFIDGALGTPEAQGIVSKAAAKIREFEGRIAVTQDTHAENYLQTQEGALLPVRHCIAGEPGWELHPAIADALREKPFVKYIEKPTFGSPELGRWLREEAEKETIREIILIGLCTDICVISNALLLKAFLPEVKLTVDASCCAGVTPESHANALSAMKMCQVAIENAEDNEVPGADGQRG